MATCLGCGVTLVHRQKVYCSVDCWRDLRRKQQTDLWLETGTASLSGTRGHYVRRHVLSEQDGRCQICGVGTEWNGVDLGFVLDHIDGDPSNNRRENLRLVCPNCDSQLPTFKSRNRGKGRHYRRQRYADGQSY